MKKSLPQSMTVGKLARLTYRYNLRCLTYGSVLLLAALAVWAATIHIIMVSITVSRSKNVVCEQLISPWHYFDLTSGIILGAVVVVIVWIGFFHREFFFTTQTDTDLRAIREVTTLQMLNPSWMTFFLSVLCFAPILTCLAVSAFGQSLSLNRSRFFLAVTLYHYLNDWGDWVPYPKFESQRQAIILLAILGLVRVSRRFGKHQVKLVGGVPKRLGRPGPKPQDNKRNEVDRKS